jgi:hypothetical protein
LWRWMVMKWLALYGPGSKRSSSFHMLRYETSTVRTKLVKMCRVFPGPAGASVTGGNWAFCGDHGCPLPSYNLPLLHAKICPYIYKPVWCRYENVYSLIF